MGTAPPESERADNMATKAQEPTSLPVHPLRVELGDGEQELHAAVVCPQRGHSVPLATCEGCAQCVGLELRGDAATHVRCTARSAPAAPAPSEPYAPLLAPLLSQARVGQLMTHDVCAVDEGLDAAELASLLSERSLSGVPVVDDAGRPSGVVSRTDLLRAGSAAAAPPLHPERAHATAGELMSPEPLAVREDTTVAYAAALMVTHAVHRLLVLSPEGLLVGVLTPTDVLRWLARRAGYPV